MRVEVNNTTYTQLNTVEDNYLIQNVGSDDLHIIFSDTAPADTASFDIILQANDAVGHNHMSGICWGKTTSKMPASVSVVES